MSFGSKKFEVVKGTFSYARGEQKLPTMPTETRSTRMRNQTSGLRGNRRNTQRRAPTLSHANQDSEAIIEDLIATVEQRDCDLEKENHRYLSLDGNFRKTLKENKQLKTQTKNLVSQKETYRAKFLAILRRVVIPYAQSKKLGIQKYTYEQLEKVLGPLLQDAKQAESLWKRVNGLQEKTQQQQDLIQHLRNQVQALQQDALNRVDNVQVVTDIRFERRFQALASLVKVMSRSIHFTENVDVVEVLSSPGFLNDVAPHCWQDRSRKKLFIEAWIWATLVIHVFHNPFEAFGKQAVCMSEVWNNIYGEAHYHNWPSPSSSCETWRRMTAERILESVDRGSTTYGDEGPKSKRRRIDTNSHREQVANILQAHLESICRQTDFSSIHTIVDTAHELAIQMALQRYRLQITFPETGARFVKGEMNAIPNRNGEDIEGGVVTFVVNPGLTKWGDARGENLDLRNDIVPALVQLGIAGTKHPPHASGSSAAYDQFEGASHNNEGELYIKRDTLIKQEPE